MEYFPDKTGIFILVGNARLPDVQFPPMNRKYDLDLPVHHRPTMDYFPNKTGIFILVGNACLPDMQFPPMDRKYDLDLPVTHRMIIF